MMKKGAFIVNYARADVIQKQVGPCCGLSPFRLWAAHLLRLLSFGVNMCTNAIA